MSNPAKFWNRVARKYAKDPIKDQKGYDKTLQDTRQYLGPDKSVLELGCGTGSTALLLAKDCKELLATDISSEMIAIAREKNAEQKRTNLQFEEVQVALPNIKPASMDVVLAFNLVHLLSEPSSEVKAIFDLVKPGGYFISKTSCLGEQSWMWPIVAKIMGPVLGLGKVQAFNFSQLEQICTNAGFIIEDRFEQYPKPPRLFLVAKRPE